MVIKNIWNTITITSITASANSSQELGFSVTYNQEGSYFETFSTPEVNF